MPYSAAERIEAEDYDVGGQGVAYSDAEETNHGGAYREDGVDLQSTGDVDGEFNVGWTRDGEWLEYTVDLDAGTYDVRVRLASPDGTGSLDVSIDGTALGTIAMPETGAWQTFETVTLQDVEVPADGEQVLRLDVVGGDFNVNWVQFVSVEPIAVDDEYEFGEKTYGMAGYGL